MINSSCYSLSLYSGKTFFTSYPKKNLDVAESLSLSLSVLKGTANDLTFVVSQNANATISSKEFFISKPQTENLKKLQKISELPDNWNGYGAKPISKEVIQEVRTTVSELNYQPEIFPLPDNEIQLEFDGPNQSYMEIVIGTKDLANVFIMDSTGNEVEKIVSKKAIISEVSSFYG